MDGKIYMPNNWKLQKKILQENHDPANIGYPGQHQIMKLIKRNYQWPEIKNNIKIYIQECFKYQQNKVQHVVATTCQNSTRSLLTLAKLSIGYLVVGITRELDKEPSLHCSSIYITYRWSVLQQCVYLISIHHASTSCPITHPHVFSLRPPCFLHVP